MFNSKHPLNDPLCRCSGAARASAETSRDLLAQDPSSDKSAVEVSAGGGRFEGLVGNIVLLLSSR